MQSGPIHTEFPFRFYDRDRISTMRRRNLPHLEQPCTCAFVTFRLQDSMPVSAKEEWDWERRQWLRRAGLPLHLPPEDLFRILSERQRRAWQRYVSSRFERVMDRGLGACVLRNIQVREVLVQVLRESAGEFFLLGDFVVMPNHVHLILQPERGYTLDGILRNLRKQSARRINKLVSRSGQLWNSESFDHLVRSRHFFRRYQTYIRLNPRRAGLKPTEYTLYQWEG